jgi:hypothetical protein
MTPEQAIKALRRKFRCQRTVGLSPILGITDQYLSNWKKSPAVSAKHLVNIVKKARDAGIKEGQTVQIQALLEYYPISKTLTSHDKKYRILDKKILRHQKIITCLEEHQGLYIFYDSMYVPIYIGRTKRKDLWFEMNDAFNRERNQEVRRVNHPRTGAGFLPAYESHRQIKKITVKLHEIATHISAYAISKRHNSAIEALLIRSMANVCKNVKMENL